MKTFSLNMKGNSKTAIPTTTSSKESCPDTCPLKESGCYAKHSFLGTYWKKLSNGEVKNALSYDELLDKIESFDDGQLWRLNQAGDLLHNNGIIDRLALLNLMDSNKGKKGFTYTHHKLNPQNKSMILRSNNAGFTINLSSNDLSEADKYINLRIAPVVTLLPINAEKVTYTPNGNKVVACPSETNNSITCKTCGLCQLVDRDYIIGFRAHGTGKKKVEIIAKSS